MLCDKRVEIMRAGAEHLDLVAPLFDAYRQFYRQEPDRSGTKRFLAERIRNGESVIFLAWDRLPNGEPHGVGFIQLYPSFSSVGMKRIWILNDLFVAPSARKAGVGRELMNHAKEFARSTQV